jgi:predicted transcriptional regulator
VRVSRRRSNIEIIADMLRVGENGAGKTEIMYSANMSYTQIQKYLGFLLSHGFIDRIEIGNPVVTYQVTEKGLGLLKNIDGIIEVLDFEEGNAP